MTGRLEPVVIELKLEAERLKSQMDAVTAQLGRLGTVAEEQHGRLGKLGEGFRELGAAATEAFAVMEVVLGFCRIRSCCSRQSKVAGFAGVAAQNYDRGN